jgi:hypothetical protein
MLKTDQRYMKQKSVGAQQYHIALSIIYIAFETLESQIKIEGERKNYLLTNEFQFFPAAHENILIYVAFLQPVGLVPGEVERLNRERHREVCEVTAKLITATEAIQCLLLKQGHSLYWKR